MSTHYGKRELRATSSPGEREVIRDAAKPVSCLVLDKSYLQGARAEEVRELCVQHTVFMPEVLICELLSTKESERMWSFSHLPHGVNPVELLPGISQLMGYEANYSKPCTPLYERRVKARFVFNESLRKPTSSC
jgi:hypothetical protein